MPAEKKPSLQLQINNSGAWKTLARFEAQNDSRLYYAKLSMEQMALADPKMGVGRIATCAGNPVVLARFHPLRGWHDVEPRT